MTSRVILRLIKKKVSFRGVREIEYSGLVGRESWHVLEYRVEPDYLVIQRTDQPDAYKKSNGAIKIAPPPWHSYCRWHDGPLWEPDDPGQRLYCVVQSESYCRQHKRSTRALYEICVSSHSQRSLDACRMIDGMGRTNYVLYLTDAGAGRVKVGVTREFRFLERLSEQAHNIATPLTVVDSLYEARRLEILVSKKNMASQVKSRRPKQVYLPKTAALITSVAERISRLLGLQWEGRLVRIVSGVQGLVLKEREARIDDLVNRELRVIGYWGGHLAFEDDDSRTMHVNDRRLVHHDSLLVDE